MIRIDGTASADVAASPERCMEILADVAAYPRWSSLIDSAEAIGDGTVLLRAGLMGVTFAMRCELDVEPGRAVLRRVPNDPADEERYQAGWLVAPREGGGAAVQLHVVAALDAPGPASLLRGRVQRRLVDDLLADFERAVD